MLSDDKKPSREWLLKMAEHEDAAGSVSVGGLAADMQQIEESTLSDVMTRFVQNREVPIGVRSEVSRAVHSLRADRDFWKEQAAIEAGRLIDLYTKHPELLPELTDEEKAACDKISLNLQKMFDDDKAEQADLIAARAEIERLRDACQKAFNLIDDEDNNPRIAEMVGSFGLWQTLRDALTPPPTKE